MVDTRGVIRLGMPGNEKPKMGELNRFLTEYCTLWRSIGYKLGLEDAVLNSIQSDCLIQRERFTVTLQKWLEQDERSTWNALELAITNARREELNLGPLIEIPSNGHGLRQDEKSQERKLPSQGEKSISASNLSTNFSSFVMTIRMLLETKCEDYDEKLKLCKEFCSNLTIGDSDVLLFSDEQLDKINMYTAFEQLFEILRKHWSWKEYSILKTIIATSESKEAEDELDKFEKLMSSYCGMELISEEGLPNEILENYVKLCIKIEKPYKSLTLQDFCELQAFIFKHLNVREYIALPFIKFLFSSLHLEWYIPMQAVSHITKMVCQNKESLIQKSIVLIRIGDKSILDTQSGTSHSDDQVDGGISSRPLRSFDKNLFDLRKVPADQIAAQMTLIDVQLFKAIKGHEFTNCAWSKKDKAEKAPHIVAFTRRFNQVCFWVEREILNKQSVRLRADVVTHFIKIAKKLLELNNLHSLMAVISGLQSAPIHRLSNTWKHVTKKDKTSYDKLLELMSQEENSKLLREHLNEFHLPCIPYLGMYLTDLTFLDLRHKKNDTLSTPITPVSRFADNSRHTPPISNIQAQIDAVHNTIGYFQNSSYVGILIEQPHIKEYLLSLQYTEELEKFVEDSNYKRSLELEPIEMAGKST